MNFRNIVCIAVVAAATLAAAPSSPHHTHVDWYQIRGRLLVTPKPEYPTVLVRARYSGTGWFRIYFDTRGEVTGIRILKSTGYRELDIETLKAFGRWRAKPGHKWELELPITFILARKARTYSPIDRW